MDENLPDTPSLHRHLAPLDEVEPPEPPPGLVFRTLAHIAEQTCKKLPPAPVRPTPVGGADRRPGRWLEWAIAASIGLVALGLTFTGVLRLWSQYNVRACEQNLASLWMTLSQYGQRHEGALPGVKDVAGPEGVAAAYVPLLYQAGLAGHEPLNVGCAARGKKPVGPCDLAGLAQLYRDEPDRFRERVRDLGGDYAYSLGYRVNGQLFGPRLDSGAEVPLLADAPGLTAVGNSPNHGGRGQNVLFIGGHVRWLTSAEIGPACDELYRNRERRIRAGIDPTDFVLAAGDAVPGP